MKTQLRGRFLRVAAAHPILGATAFWGLTLFVGAGAVVGADFGLPVWLTLAALLWLGTAGLPTTLGVLLVASAWGRIPALNGFWAFIGCAATAGLVLQIISWLGFSWWWSMRHPARP